MHYLHAKKRGMPLLIWKTNKQVLQYLSPQVSDKAKESNAQTASVLELLHPHFLLTTITLTLWGAIQLLPRIIF